MRVTVVRVNQVLWLLGQKLWLKERLSRLQQGFLYFSQNMGFYVWELDKAKQLFKTQIPDSPRSPR